MLREGRSMQLQEQLEAELEADVEFAEAKARLKQGLNASLSRMADLFRMWDVDGSGTIGPDEFAKAATDLGLRDEELVLPRELCDAVFSDCDALRWPEPKGLSHFPALSVSFAPAPSACSLLVVSPMCSTDDADGSGQMSYMELLRSMLRDALAGVVSQLMEAVTKKDKQGGKGEQRAGEEDMDATPVALSPVAAPAQEAEVVRAASNTFSPYQGALGRFDR